LLTNIRLDPSLILWFWRLGWAADGRANWEAIRMGGSATPDRDELRAFELALDAQVYDEVRPET
jgi:hypothetical protein